MTNIDAFLAFNEGKKIRLTTWVEHKWIQKQYCDVFKVFQCINELNWACPNELTYLIQPGNDGLWEVVE